MNTLEALFTRKSIRRFSDKPIDDETLRLILRAGMSGPCCVNARDWSFIVVRNKETLAKMAEANGRPAAPLLSAAAAVLICGDLDKAFPPAQEYWVIDGAIAAQNMTLAAHELGLGSVWLGTWPQMDRVKKQAELFSLPQTQVPHSILALGYPENSSFSERNLLDEEKIHWDKW